MSCEAAGCVLANLRIQEHWFQVVFKMSLQKQAMLVQERCRCGQGLCHLRLHAPNTLRRRAHLSCKTLKLRWVRLNGGTDTGADLEELHLMPFMHSMHTML